MEFMLGRRDEVRHGVAFRAVIAFIAVLIVAALTAGRAEAARHRHAAAKTASSEEESAESAASKQNVQYAEACVMEPVTGTVIFDADDHKPWPTASLAKMMLMYIVAQKLDDGSLKLTDQITTSRKAAEMGGSQVYLKEGETFSLDDMMKAIIVHSANDASVAVAEYIAGSTDAFVQLMNQKAAELGMKDSHYYSCNGLPPAAGQQADVASAYDQALLARALIKYPQILKWSAIDTAPFRNATFVLRNTNHMVRTYQGCDGLKTGFYDKAGFNVVATAKRGNLRLIAVVLGTTHKLTNFKMASELMSQGFLNYDMHAVATKGQPAAQSVAISNGAVPSFKPIWAGDAAFFVKRGEANNLIKVDYKLPATISAPIKAGQQVGSADLLENGKPVTTIALVAPSDIAEQKSSLVGRLLSKF